MNRKKAARAATICAAAILMAGAAHAGEGVYLSAKGGVFLPNGKDGGDYKGFKYLDTGYNFEVAAGYRMVPYAAVEVGTGYYTASGTVSNVGLDGVRYSIDRTAYGVPVTLSAKGIMEFDKLMLSAGAGIGYYQGFLENKITFSDAKPTINQTNHGSALGYQAMFDADFKVADNWLVGANFKWFSARPEIELTDQNNRTTKDKWEFGGTTVNLGVKYTF